MNKKHCLLGGAVMGLLTIWILGSCNTIPKGAKAVKPFNGEKYMGKWFEIARLDFRFEKDLNNTTATYSFNTDRTIKVVNRGYNYKKKEWKESTGKAKFIGSPGEAKLKVSFFGPFYAGYNVLAIDPTYQNALVAGKNLKYLWLLSREKTMPGKIKNDYLQLARELGYRVDDLVWVEHDK